MGRRSRTADALARHEADQAARASGDPTCALCERAVPPRLISLHHLLPKSRGGGADVRVPVCAPCHKQVHATFGNADLAEHYASVEALRDAEPLRSFLDWVRKQRPDRTFRTARSGVHPSSRR